MMRIGQRMTAIVTLPLSVAVWLTLSFSNKVWVLLVSRFCIGFVIGCLFSSSNTYILETTHKSVRGRFFGALILLQYVASVFVAIMGILELEWRHIGYVCIIISSLAFVGTMSLPNSPRWLATQGRWNDVQKSLIYFRGEQYNLEEELKEIIEEADEQSQTRGNSWQQLRKLLEPSTFRMFVLLIILWILYGFNGYDLTLTYLVPIFQATDSSIDPYICAVICTSITVIGGFVQMSFVDKIGRKLVITVSYLFSTISMAAFGSYFYFLENGNVVGIRWLPLTSSVVFIFFTSMVQTVLNLIPGELLPTPCRCVGVTLCQVVRGSAAFTALQTYPKMIETLGQHGTFWFYSGCSALAGIIALNLPETRGLSLEHISKHQRSHSSLQHDNTLTPETDSVTH